MSECYPGYEEWTRVSTVADAIARLDSDGLMYVGADWASKKALAITEELLNGVISPDVEKWLLYNQTDNHLDYLKSDWFASSIKASCKQEQQSTADRGTLLGKVWDVLSEDATVHFLECMDYVEALHHEQSEAARLSVLEYQTAVSMGLVDTKDKSKKPKRGYQCTMEDVEPYVKSLTDWWPRCPFVSKSKQRFLKDESNQVCGTWDDFGNWGDIPNLIVDVKSSTQAQPKPYHRAQLAKYQHMYGLETGKLSKAMNVIVTPDSVYPRILTDKGYANGINDFNNALEILKRSSMKDNYLSAAQSLPKDK